MQTKYDSTLNKVVVVPEVWQPIVDGVNRDLKKFAGGTPGQTIIVLANDGKIKQNLEVLGFPVENFDSNADAHIVTLSEDLKGTGQPVVVPAVEVK
jgi:hypothetical protein